MTVHALGGDGLDPIGCLGCHGRNEGAVGVTGAGLRQHHYNSEVTGCLGCHSDSNPATFTTVGEEVLPPYYENPGNNHPNIPSSPCNPEPDYPEDVLGLTGSGLDNDGDDVYDEADTDCNPTGVKTHPSYDVELEQDYPNQFNPETTIRFTLQKRTKVRLDVFSTDGKLVRTLVSQELSAGSYHIPWDGRDWAGNLISSRVYFCRVQTPGHEKTMKMTPLK